MGGLAAVPKAGGLILCRARGMSRSGFCCCDAEDILPLKKPPPPAPPPLRGGGESAAQGSLPLLPQVKVERKIYSNVTHEPAKAGFALVAVTLVAAAPWVSAVTAPTCCGD